MRGRGLPLATLAAGALLVGCGDREERAIEPAIEPAQLEQAIRETLPVIGTQSVPNPTVDCEAPEGDGIAEPWSCLVEARARPEGENSGAPGTQVELTAFVLDEGFGVPGAFAAVQTGGDGLSEGGGATGTFGCCIEDADLGTPDKYLD